MRANNSANFVEHLSWDKIAARIAKGAAAILPIGAGAKQHGFHLPMNTDRIQAEAFASRLAGKINALVWPTVSYGYYPAFSAYAGSCSLSQNTFESLIGDITAGLLGHGCEAVFVLDTGISTIAPVDDVLTRIGSCKTLHLKIHDGVRYKLAVQRIVQQKYGSHADEIETSLMLALGLHLVDMERAEASPDIQRARPGPLTPFDPSSPNYSPSGSFGDPASATRAKGELFFAAIIDDLVEQTENFLADTSARRALSESSS